MKARRIATIAALAAVAVTGVLAAAGSAGTNGIASGNLVFSGIDPADGTSDIYVMKTDGSGKANLTHDQAIRKDTAPSWSRDGSRIVFSRHAGTGGSSIMLVKADGTGLTTLTGPAATAPAQNVDPSWSADSSRIVFASNRDGNFDLYWLKPGNPQPVRLTKTAAPVQNLDPSWSPDGKAIVFSRSGHRPAGTTTASSAELYQLSLATGSTARLTKTIAGRGDRGPVYSPDGRSIAFYSDRSGNEDVYLLSTGGDKVRQLTTSLKSDVEPSFSPDGSALVFVSNRTGATELWASSLISLQPGLNETQFTSDKQPKSHPGWAPAAADRSPVGPPTAISSATDGK